MWKERIQWALPIVALALIVPLGCTSMGSERAQELEAQANKVASNKEVLNKFIEYFMAGNWAEDLPKVIATDCVVHYPGGRDVVGLDAMIAGWAEFYPKLANLEADNPATISEGDMLAVLLIYHADYTGEYMGRQMDGVPISYMQTEFWRIDDGKIVEWWIEYDRQWMAEQLGMEMVWK